MTTNVGNFVRFRTNPNRPARTVRTRVPIPAADRLTEEQYNNYRNNLDQEPYSYAFDCLRRNVLRTLNTPSALSHHGPITREETYCEFSREFVDDARKIWEPTDTRAFYLPCGAEITAPEPTDPPPSPPGVPELITIDQVKIDHTGSGYSPDDTILIGGEPVDFETDPSGAYQSYQAGAIGSGRSDVIEFFENNWKKNLTELLCWMFLSIFHILKDKNF